MSPAPEWTLKDLQRQVARLQDELDRVRSGQPQEQPHRRDATAWLGATLLIVGTWALSAAASATTSTDLEARVRALEGLVRRGPRGNVEIAAPLEVVSGTGNVIMRVGGSRGMVAAGPKYQCGPMPGMRVVPSPLTSCITGLIN